VLDQLLNAYVAADDPNAASGAPADDGSDYERLSRFRDLGELPPIVRQGQFREGTKPLRGGEEGWGRCRQGRHEGVTIAGKTGSATGWMNRVSDESFLGKRT